MDVDGGAVVPDVPVAPLALSEAFVRTNLMSDALGVVVPLVPVAPIC
jgi:hypothetical protein